MRERTSTRLMPRPACPHRPLAIIKIHSCQRLQGKP